MSILYAVELGTNYYLYIDLEETKFYIERIYYKLALIEKLKDAKYTVILSQSLEEDLELKDITKIFEMAKTNSILIIGEQYRDSGLLVELLNSGIYNGVFKDDVDSDYIIHLLNNERTIEEAKDYYAILSDYIVNKEEIKKEKIIKLIYLKFLKIR